MCCSCGRTRWAWWKAKVGSPSALLPSSHGHWCHVCPADCKREDFLYDSNFDTSNLERTYPHGREVRVYCKTGYSGFFKLVCTDGVWTSKGKLCKRKLYRGSLHGTFSIISFQKSLAWQQHVLYVYSCMLSNFLRSPWRCPVRRLSAGRGRRFCLWIQSRLHLQQRVEEYSYVIF